VGVKGNKNEKTGDSFAAAILVYDTFSQKRKKTLQLTDSKLDLKFNVKQWLSVAFAPS
jgi:hypothetical protein